MSYYSPEEILDVTEHKAKVKASNSFLKVSILAFFAGMYIALGSVANVLVNGFVSPLNKGLALVLGSSVFPVGLMMVLICGGELFTGNTLIAVSVFQKKTRIRDFVKNLAIVWVFNFVGSLFIAFITYKTHTFNQECANTLFSIASHKVEASFFDIVLKGILCNVLVAGSVWASYGAKDIIGKVFIIWFPIMLFIILGYDHVVANMLYLPTALFYGLDMPILDVVKNLVAATIGNIIGGSFIIAGLYNLSLKTNNK